MALTREQRLAIVRSTQKAMDAGRPLLPFVKYPTRPYHPVLNPRVTSLAEPSALTHRAHHIERKLSGT